MLEQLLTQTQQFDIDTKIGGFTNHLPMALIALHKLGASDLRLKAFFDSYSENLKPITYKKMEENFDWKQNLGKNDKFGAYLEYFTQQVEKSNCNEVITSHINQLIKGCAASAFHALIRLSYGIIQENTKEIIFGLAHLSSHFFEIPTPSKSKSNAPDILKKSLDSFSVYNASGDTITNRMKDIAKNERFSGINKYPEHYSLASFGKLFAGLYLRTQDFTVLHAVTSCHAMRILLPFIKDNESAIITYWSAAIVAILSVERLNFKEDNNIQSKPLSELNLEDVINSNNDHLIKLVYSSIEEYKIYDEENYLDIINSKLNT